jgi:hypothetical protein
VHLQLRWFGVTTSVKRTPSSASMDVSLPR